MNDRLTIGIAPDSWGVWFAKDDRQVNWERYLQEVASLGMRHTELGPFGYMPTDPARLAQELGSRGMSVVAGGVMFDIEDPQAWAAVRPEAESVCRLLAEMQAPMLILIDDVHTDLKSGERRLAQELSEREWSRLLDGVARVQELADSHGLRCGFHPHADTHVQSEPQIERLLADSPDLGLCLDVGHHAYCGGDPVPFYRRHHERVCHLHLKSVDPAVLAKVRERRGAFGPAVAEGVFVEPELGLVDFYALHDALVECEYEGFAIIEQDMYPAPPEKPLPIARRTLAQLAEVGIA